ncbi:MAG: MgtC/SapB family protein [Candidatus Aenigmarchaeota archaeon]|nr:MgtC/SapB family protein [Candidatus Aenigmarchaeota archaeon]
MALEVIPFNETEVLLKLFAAMGLGALIGLERELKFSHVGIKTFSIVALGAALFTMMSISVNSAIAAGVITGVGFLGAGAIFRSNDRVRGLTTASLLWIAAAIGMAVGYGHYQAAVITTFIVYIVLVFIAYIEKKYIEKLAASGISLEKLTEEQIDRLTDLVESGTAITNRELKKLEKDLKRIKRSRV